MQAESRANHESEVSPRGSETLAEGLMLIRASTLKMIRLQLAMERHDRQVALAAVDDLVELDRRLDHYLGEVPATKLQVLRHELEIERARLNLEKLGLGAEVIRGGTAVEERAAEPARAAEKPLVVEPIAPAGWEGFAFQEEPAPRRRGRWVLVTLLVVLAVAAAAYWLVGLDAMSGTLNRYFSLG